MAELIDISPPLSPDIAVFPGDTNLSREVLMDMQRGDHLTLSTLRSTVHVGAHIDGPNHYGRDGQSVDQLPLELFVGPCQVVRVAANGMDRISVDALNDVTITEQRILLRTDSYPDPNQWCEFAGLEPELVDHLHNHGVKLVGIDTPSVDPGDAKKLIAHERFLANDMIILEGLLLRDVATGRYELIALPLRLVGFDASPVRAVLRKETAEALRRGGRTND